MCVCMYYTSVTKQSGRSVSTDSYILFLDLHFTFFLFIGIQYLYRGIHCDIYVSAYNISKLNFPPPSFFFISSHLFLEQCQHVSLFCFHTCVQSTPTIFALLLCLPISPTLVPSLRQDLFYLLILHFLSVS
jgi:hypothetical protein